jgi:tRNA A-37 threonylcarbamoyl transferase component Bud32
VAAALALHVKRRPWMDALDRRFFRERYDAYRLLAGVADDVRQSASFDDAARQVMARIDDALHPARASVMVRAAGATFFESAASIGGSPPSVPAGAKLVALARLLGKPLENTPAGAGWLARQLPGIEMAFLRRARVEWLFPVSLRGTGAEAFLLLGPKRSEEPYSREDRQLLGAVAASLGLLLERAFSSGFAECPACGSCYAAGTTSCARDLAPLVKSPYPRMLAGRYRFDRRLGSGGMGVVYEAFDAALKRQVAVKVIRPELLASPDALARFRREARIAARLSHPAVVNVHDFGVADDGRAYIVMERLEGHTLREEMRERGALDPGTALEILAGVAEALALAHEQGLVHRDLKPENVFIERSGQRVVARVLDFGLAKPLVPGATETVLPTIAGGLLGTPAYMSPEQLRGDPPSEGWDIWALTVVAFEMLAGTRPLAVSGHPTSPGASAGPVPTVAGVALAPPAREFFERAFAADSTRRPSSARQVVEELRAALQLCA